MKSLLLYIGILLVVLNSITGCILTSYFFVNWIASDIVLLINTILIHIIANSKINNAYKVSFLFLFPFFGLISFILTVLSPAKIIDNLYFIGVIFIEITLLIISKYQLPTNQKKI
jgi:hypothetical protein